jgi:hypothetical protein
MNSSRNSGKNTTSCISLYMFCFAFFAVMTPAQAAPVCGPGPNWVDTCPSGTDDLPFTRGFHTLEIIGGGTISVELFGSGSVFRSDGPGPNTDNAIIRTEMVSLTLSGPGITMVAGDGLGNLAPDGPLHSPGTIEEQGPVGPLADSFFDIFFEISGPALGALGPLHNNTAARMHAVIPEVPPPFPIIYIAENLPLPLFDVNGIERAFLVEPTFHQIWTPEPSALLLIGSGGLVFLFLRKKLSRQG